jgi:hypothetical protein
MTLDTLAIEYGTDKSSKWHNYTKLYSKYFEGMRLDVKKVLELGVDRGGSLKMWRDYFPNAKIYGIDNDFHCEDRQPEGTKVFIGKQEDTEFLDGFIKEVGGDFDIIVDDAGHDPQAQRVSFEYLFDHLKPGGIYVVEDLFISYHPGLKSFVEYLKARIDDVNFEGWTNSGNLACANPEKLLKAKPEPNRFEKSIESIHFYTWVTFIFKRGIDGT